jgi:metaxin
MPSKTARDGAAEDAPGQRDSSRVKDLFSIPAPVKKLFDLVPVVTYPSNPLPSRSPKSSRISSLYIFSTARDAAAGRPSFNPSCLKWQVNKILNHQHI